MKRAFNFFVVLTLLALTFGALGVSPVYAATLTVTNTNDSGAGSLRQAIASAAAGDTITFDPSLSGATINLASTLTLTKNVTIDGSALASQVNISGQNTVQVFAVNGGVNATLNGLKISQGLGGGIRTASATLTVNNSTFSGNSAGDGGAIYMNQGTLNVNNSTFSGNSSSGYGGAIDTFYGSVNVTNSTFYNNTATNIGGALNSYNNFQMSVTNSTFYQNSSATGGTISSLYNTVNLYNTIVANTTAGGDCYGILGGTFSADPHNFDGDGSCGNATTTAAIKLGSLASNGGPTQTMALLSGSPAIDAGASCPATDQRGVARPIGAACDSGAYEYNPLLLADSFVSGPDLNDNLAGRQTGSLATKTYSAGIPAQCTVDAGGYLSCLDAYSPDYDFNSASGASAGGIHLSIKANINPNLSASTTTWLCLSLGATAGNRFIFPTDGSAPFWNCFRADGRFFAFNNGTDLTPVEPYWNPAGDYSNTWHTFDVYASDPSDNDPFDGAGSTKLQVYADGSYVYSYEVTGGGFTENYISLFNDSTVNTDDLSISHAAAPEMVAPTVDRFTATSPSSSLNIPITAFAASDNTGVTGYMITESATAPIGNDLGWAASAPATYTVAADGTYTLYPWVKDAVGNVSAVYGSPATVIVNTIVPDTTKPVVTIDAGPAATTNKLSATFTFSGTDDVSLPANLVFECGIDGGFWLPCSSPKTYTGLAEGAHQFWLQATDEAGNTSVAVYSLWQINPKTITYTSVGTQDGWILESTETSNVGGSVNATGTTLQLGDDIANKQYKSILSFNTAPLPDTAVIKSAVLKIKQFSTPVGTNPFSVLGGLLVDIRKGFFGTAALQTTDFSAAASAAKVATFNKVPMAGWYSAIVSATGRTNILKTGTTQFRLYFTKDDDNNKADADYMLFVSGNPTSNKPQLVISYFEP
jgi:predicted outer membrane repeat protein